MRLTVESVSFATVEGDAAGVAVIWRFREFRRARQSLVMAVETGQAIALRPLGFAWTNW